jgi:hypothetical protein
MLHNAPLSLSSPVPRFTYATATAVFCAHSATRRQAPQPVIAPPGASRPAARTTRRSQHRPPIAHAAGRRTLRPKVCTDCARSTRTRQQLGSMSTSACTAQAGSAPPSSWPGNSVPAARLPQCLKRAGRLLLVALDGWGVGKLSTRATPGYVFPPLRIEDFDINSELDVLASLG